MGEQFCRWDPEAKVINIRLSNVMSPEDYARFEGWQEDPWSRAWKSVSSLRPWHIAAGLTQ